MLEDRRQRAPVLLGRGPGVRVEEGQLGADQPGALRAGGKAGPHLGAGRGVHQHVHQMAVERHGRQLAVGLRPRLGGAALLGGAAGLGHPLGRGVEHGLTRAAVHHQLRAGLGVEHAAAEAHRHRYAERARHDRGVRRDRAGRERDRLGLLAQLGHVGGPEILGHQHVGRAGALLLPRSRAGGQPRRAPGERAHVVRARREVRIGQRSDEVGVPAGGRHQRRGRGAGVLEHLLAHRPLEQRVGGHQRTGLDDRRLGLAARGAHLRGQPVKLAGRRRQGGERPLGLGRRPRRGHLFGGIGQRGEDPGAPRGESGRRRGAAQNPLGHQRLMPRSRPLAGAPA